MNNPNTKASLKKASLKPCPFCASNDIRYSSEGKPLGFDKNHVFWCGNCGAFGPNDIDAFHAIDMWNMRRTVKS